MGDVCWLAELAQLVILTSSLDRRPSNRSWPPAASPASLLSFTDEGDTPSSPLPASSSTADVTSTLKLNKDPVRELLVELGDDPTARPLLAHGFIDRFRPVDDGAYDDIRAMLATVEAAGWMSLTQTAIAS